MIDQRDSTSGSVIQSTMIDLNLSRHAFGISVASRWASITREAIANTCPFRRDAHQRLVGKIVNRTMRAFVAACAHVSAMEHLCL